MTHQVRQACGRIILRPGGTESPLTPSIFSGRTDGRPLLGPGAPFWGRTPPFGDGHPLLGTGAPFWGVRAPRTPPFGERHCVWPYKPSYNQPGVGPLQEALASFPLHLNAIAALTGGAGSPSLEGLSSCAGAFAPRLEGLGLRV